jgi:hypothetical protein
LQFSPYIAIFKKTIDGWTLAPFLEIEDRRWESGGPFMTLNYTAGNSLGRAVFSKTNNWIAVSSGLSTTPYNLYKVNASADLTEPKFYASKTNTIANLKSEFSSTFSIETTPLEDTYNFQDERIFNGSLRQQNFGYINRSGLKNEEVDVILLFTSDLSKQTL